VVAKAKNDCHNRKQVYGCLRCEKGCEKVRGFEPFSNRSGSPLGTTSCLEGSCSKERDLNGFDHAAEPLLYLSLFFKQHRSRYYELLDGVRQQGDWEAWIDFFLEGVESTASAAVTTAHRLLELFRSDEARLKGLGRSGPSVRLGYAALRRRPLTGTKQLKELSGLSFPTASKAIETLVDLGIAREITGGRRNRLFAYDAYLAILSEGTEPL